ncbi:MAG: hypothetical protein FOGNACKC_05492 [Anaerolineae bacterium]|nr:hypothetical protein [Anaerolineae bacterium]
MADNKNAQTIPVELLLSSIGQQVRGDIEARRARLQDEIEKKRQRLAELRQRRLEVSDRADGETPPAPVDEAAPPLPAAGGLFNAAELADTGPEDDWLLDPGELEPEASDLLAGLPETDDAGFELPALDATLSDDAGFDLPALDDVWGSDDALTDSNIKDDLRQPLAKPDGVKPTVDVTLPNDAGFELPALDDDVWDSEAAVAETVSRDEDNPPPGNNPGNNVAAGGMEDILSDVAGLDPDLLNEDWGEF